MKRFWIKFNGLSMYPLLKDEDQILIESVNASDLNIGDIVLFLDEQSRELTLHRLIDFPLVTKGDFSLLAESNSESAVLGRAVGFDRKDYYRAMPAPKGFLYWSKLRMKGKLTRKLALLILFVLTRAFELYSDKTRLNHNREQLLSDPSSHV